MKELFGVGIYDSLAAHRLTRVPRHTIDRWLRGYTTQSGVRHDPMWISEIPQTDDLALSFRDVIELKTVHAFRKRGVSAQLLRKAIRVASELLGDSHPFSTARFRTDGASILLEIDRQQGEPELVNIFTNQREMKSIIEQSLKDVEFDEESNPYLWRPLGRGSGVVLDPERSLGQPIEEESAIPTHTLALAVRAEGNAKQVAEIYEIPLRSVNRAVRFEDWLNRAA